MLSPGYSQLFRDNRPPLSEHNHILHNGVVLLGGPLTFHQVRIQVIPPFLPAGMGGFEVELVGVQVELSCNYGPRSLEIVLSK